MPITTIFSGDNPTELYLKAYSELKLKGKEVFPRGLRVKELRPVIFEFTNPLNRVTFLGSRFINPFFQLAESAWIMNGSADVDFLTHYNKGMKNFSDDGEYFNAPYGERLRYWGKNALRNKFTTGERINQFHDVYHKLKNDPDTRQAIAVIYNPEFDNYTVPTKDRPCNDLLSFKLRDNHLDLSVYNRSNDLHWGTFGANLCQFSTILEMMSSWLGVEVGTYFQITDSLHVYLDDYGHKINDKVDEYYNFIDDILLDSNIVTPQYDLGQRTPRMSSNLFDFERYLSQIFDGKQSLSTQINDNETFQYDELMNATLHQILKIPDPYLRLILTAMFIYRAHKNDHFYAMVEGFRNMEDCDWKVSCLRFLAHQSPGYKSNPMFTKLYKNYPYGHKLYIEGDK